MPIGGGAPAGQPDASQATERPLAVEGAPLPAGAQPAQPRTDAKKESAEDAKGAEDPTGQLDLANAGAGTAADKSSKDPAKLDPPSSDKDTSADKPAVKKQKIELMVVSARHLPKTDTFGSCDPYFVLTYGGKDAKTS
eukprot:1434041-Rhodomonas_salina.1